jgi:hypothetical protein
VKALCTALGVDVHEHHEVKGIDKASIKSKIRSLKPERDKAIAAHDSKQLKAVRLQLKNYRKQLRKAMV